MACLHISLLGPFRAYHNEETLEGLSAGKAQELLCYLLLNENTPCVRELLASHLWGDHTTTSQSKTYLRKALWQLRATLRSVPELCERDFITTEGDCIQLRLGPDVWLDVAVLKEAYGSVRGVPGCALHPTQVQAVKAAVQLYRGDLLTGWYADWCVRARAKFQEMHLIMLDKLAGWCEAHGEYEAGIEYGQRILEYDVARERTHRHLMRLYHLAGYRMNALRQYDTCVTILKEELDVQPARRTVDLYEQIRKDEFAEQAPPPRTPRRAVSTRSVDAKTGMTNLNSLMGSLQRLQASLTQIQHQLQQAMTTPHLPPNPTEMAKKNADGDN